MKRLLAAALLFSSFLIPHSSFAAEPLRVFIRAGEKSHAPGAHDFPQFLKDWTAMLNERGAKCEGSLEFPTKEQLDRTDVLILHAQEAGNIQIGEQRKNLMAFLARGGGLVVLHAGAVSRDHDWFKSIIGGSWKFGQTKWLEAPLSLYFTDRDNPITQDISNFDLDDEIYYDMDLLPDVKVLAAAYTPKGKDTEGKGNQEAQARAAEAVAKKKGVNIYDIQPQMWTYEIAISPDQTPTLNSQLSTLNSTPYRAFVCIPGHWYQNFSHNGLRTAILRGIAWAGKRENVDEFCKPGELGDALRYVEGGVPRPQDMPQHLEIHPEFEISLVAAEPLINNPMNIDWDEKGRLWVVETPEYPNGLRQANVESWMESGSLRPGVYEREPEDRISILEDTDGDGVMDKKTVFADKIELATSSVFYKNGVIVCAAPDIWFFEDTDGDDVADKRTKLYTNLGIRDTHAVINNMRWGLDGWIYATHGYSNSDNVIGFPQGEKPEIRNPKSEIDCGPIGAGVVRFKPDGTAFEQYASRSGNTWGLDITWDGQVFYTQPTTGNPLVHVVLPEYVLAKGKLPGVVGTNAILPDERTFPAMEWEHQAYVQIDQVGRYTAGAGCAIYQGGAWPEKWNYSYFVGEPTLNIVGHFFVEPDGVTYKAKKEAGREQTEFIRSRNLWFRPIETRVGPDGALYIVDFCNQAVIHNDTRGPTHGPANAAVRPDRDHYYGRIWKVQHKEAKKVEVAKMDKQDLPALIQETLNHPNAKVRLKAWEQIISNYTLDEVTETAPKVQLGFEGQLAFAEFVRNSGWMLESEKPDRAKAYADLPEAEKVEVRQSYEDILTNHINLVRPIDLIQLEDIMSDAEIVKSVLRAYSAAQDDWTRSAFIAACSDHALETIQAALKHGNAAQLESLVAALLDQALNPQGKQIPGQLEAATALILACTDADQKAEALQSVILRGIAQQAEQPAELSQDLTDALKKLLAQPALAAATLPLVTKWDKDGALAGEVKTQLDKLGATLSDNAASVETRVNAANALIAVGGNAADVGVKPLGDHQTPDALQSAIIQALDEQAQAERLTAVFDRLKPLLQQQAFEAILKRPAAVTALLDAVKAGSIDRAAFAPGDVARLRNHPNKPLAQRAINLFKVDTSAKDAIIAALAPEVEKPGDTEKGKMIFTAACAICHKLGEPGARVPSPAAAAAGAPPAIIGNAVGPDLTGMGAHGPAELLVHIIDPNREVDPSFWAFNITTKKDEVLQGVITGENNATVMLATQTGLREIAKSDIAKRENTQRSLMPEGLEALGAENLRDLLAYMCGDAMKQFRILNLADAFTADSREGVFAGSRPDQGQIRLAKLGNFSVEGIPFFIQDAARSPSGANLIVLKGGPRPDTHSQSFPPRVEVAVNVKAKRLHLLSGISGWGYPAVKDETPALRAVVLYEDGKREAFRLINGVHFSDYIRPVEVSGSRYIEGVTQGQQMRLLTLELSHPAAIKTLVLESPPGNKTVPVIAAVTADIEGSAGILPVRSTPGILPGAKGKAKAKGKGKAGDRVGQASSLPGQAGSLSHLQPKIGGQGDGPLHPATPPQWEAGKTKVLVIGGGSSHDFAKFFGTTDVETLKAAGFTVHYTEDRDQAAAELANADVAVISVNRKFFDTTAYRKTLFDFAAAGKGIVMMHPGTWYGYQGWPELNAQIVGGGARGHDKIHSFEVKKVKGHAIMEGVPEVFTVEDELYYVNAEPDNIPPGTAQIEVLAETSPSDKFQKPHPSVWITRHPQARIVCIAPGHDERTHDHPAFKRLLTNAVDWAAGKPE